MDFTSDQNVLNDQLSDIDKEKEAIIQQKIAQLMSQRKQDNNNIPDEAYKRIMSPDVDLSEQIKNAAINNSNQNPFSDDISNQVALRRALSMGGGGSRIPILLPGGTQINTYDPSAEERNAKWANEPYEKALKKKELSDTDLQRLTQAQNILDLQGARKSQELQRYEAIKKMADEINQKKENNNPGTVSSLQAESGFNRFLNSNIDLYKNSQHPTMRKLASQLEQLRGIADGKSRSQIDLMQKNIESQIDNARQMTGIDVNKELGGTKNVISIEGLGEGARHHRVQEDLDREEFEAREAARKQKEQEKNKKTSDSNRKADMYTTAAINADNDIDRYSQNYNPASQFQFQNMPERFKSAERKKYESSKLAWMDNINYLRSGASMAKLETERAEREFFPTIGDSPENIQIKKERRKKFLDDTRKAYALENDISGNDSINNQSNKKIDFIMKSRNISRDEAIKLLQSTMSQ